jgi:hypothetical protein
MSECDQTGYGPAGVGRKPTHKVTYHTYPAPGNKA